MMPNNVIPIRDDPHYADYAEFAHSEKFDWVERTTERMRKDDEAEALFIAAVSLGVIFLLTWVLPAAWKVLR